MTSKAYLSIKLYRDCAVMLEESGYTVKTLNLVSMLNSDRWNPLNEVSTDQDAQVFAEVVIANTGMPGVKKAGGDPFWDRAEQNLLKALSLYVVSEYAPEKRNLGSLYTILAAGDDRQVDMLFTALPDGHPAKDPYNIYRLSGDKVKGSVVLGLGTRLQIFQNKAVQDLTAASDIDLSAPGMAKCAYFCVFPDTHSTFDFLVSLFFSFLFIRLIGLADKNSGPCPVNVHFILDEFANIGALPDFDKKISTMRSRGIFCSLILQSVSQLQSRYPGDVWSSIIGNCASKLLLGANDIVTAKFIKEVVGAATVETKSYARQESINPFEPRRVTVSARQRYLLMDDEIMRLPQDMAVLMMYPHKPAMLKKMDYTKHPLASRLAPRPITEYVPEWRKDNTKTGELTAESPAGPEASPDGFWN